MAATHAVVGTAEELVVPVVMAAGTVAEVLGTKAVTVERAVTRAVGTRVAIRVDMDSRLVSGGVHGVQAGVTPREHTLVDTRRTDTLRGTAVRRVVTRSILKGATRSSQAAKQELVPQMERRPVKRTAVNGSRWLTR
jgi:hypothetical protein